MPSNRDSPKRRGVWLGIAALTLAFTGYRVYAIRKGATPAPRGPAPAVSATGSAAAGPAPHVLLDPSTRRKMRLGPRRGASAAVAFGKGRFGQIIGDGLTIRDTTTYRVTLPLELE